MTVSPWRAVLRIAGREAWRNRSRSLLVIALIGLPVVVLTAADVVVRSYDLSPSLAYERANGAASVELTATSAQVAQKADGLEYEPAGVLPRARLCVVAGIDQACGGVARVTSLLGVGARVVDRRVDPALTVRTPAGLGLATLTGVDYGGPVAEGVARQVSGRAPRSPREVAVTTALAAEADLHVGSTLRTVSPARSFSVVGIVTDAVHSHLAEALTLPSAVRGEAVQTDYLALTPRPVSWQEVRRLDAEGWVVQSRQVTADPPPASEVAFRAGARGRLGPLDEQQVVSGALLAGMALLEVILLAGPAFAVMARRQERSLALVGAVGGRPRDLRNAVLAHGIVLGGVGGVGGVLLGIAAGRLSEPLLAPHASHRFGPLTLHPVDLIGIALVSLVTALLAAVMPARAAARTDVVAVLAGRRPRRRARAQVPIAAAVVAGLGVLVALAGASRGGSATKPILVGVALMELGLVVATPTILVVITRVGRYLPLGPRLALRDAGRNRSSAAPAVAAVMAAVIGCVAVLLGVGAQNAMEKRTYHPQALPGEVTFDLRQISGGTAEVVAAMRDALPTRSVQVISLPGPYCGAYCVAGQVGLPPTSRMSRYVEGSGGQTVVAGPSALFALTGVRDPAAEAALAAGRAVVTDAWEVHDGMAVLQVERFPASDPNDQSQTVSADGSVSSRTVRVPAVALTKGFAAAQTILPPSLARRIGVGSYPSEVLADDFHTPDGAQQQALRAALGHVAADHPLPASDGYDGPPVFRVETGWRYDDEARLVLALLAAALVAVAAAGIATGLSNADRAEDLAVLEAVGGSGRTRRLVSLSRAGVIAGIGAVLGAAAGFVPALAWIASRNHAYGSRSSPYSLHLTVPWMSLVAVVVGIPLVAAILAGALSRSRLPRRGVLRPGGTP